MQIDGLYSKSERSDLTIGSEQRSISTSDGQLSVNVVYPIMEDDYNKTTDQMEPKLFGFVVLAKALDQLFADQVSELAGMYINIFAGKNMAAGRLESYKVFSGETILEQTDKKWQIKEQQTILGDVNVGEASQMAQNAGNMTQIAQSITTSTNRMSENISSIANAVGQASDNIGIVASSTEEMNATIAVEKLIQTQ